MDLLTNIFTGLAAVGVVYGGIRADLKHLTEGIKAAQSEARRAHQRIDNHIEKHGRA
ncbi:LPP leucine zipper domain-containing protein [Pseudoduganella namucuonensis]|uniref:Lipoprotein leucine-zipper n=1 Tax=Pseudoduganella namucuonensis TaxID=1035707 RepID=A0A1I7M7H4_9BURK|nr:LPP leucine zipper domain-containing protein [Pseudoduganella namucuonensis]SFV17885.1 Lipoprotein leucine-zipper [Pseudoduganella namucuonensis]